MVFISTCYMSSGIVVFGEGVIERRGVVTTTGSQCTGKDDSL